MSDYVSLGLGFCMRKIWPGLLKYHISTAKQQSTSLFNKILDTLLDAQQFMPPNDYICDVLMIRILALQGNSLYLLDDPHI